MDWARHSSILPLLTPGYSFSRMGSEDNYTKTGLLGRGPVITMSYSLILGGAKSGKSRYAEQRATELSIQTGWPVTYLATATVTDPEMAERIAAHRVGRPASWNTIEEALNIADWLTESHDPTVVLLDCLSLLLNNWMFSEPEDRWLPRQDQLYEALLTFPYPVIVVSNEVGQGIVPDHRIARQYRDQLGRFNQKLATTADPAIFMIAGLPVDLRKMAPA